MARTLNSAATIIVLMVVVLSAFIGAEWAPTVNTALIFLLAAYQAHERRQLRKAHEAAQLAHREARDAKRLVGATRRDTPPGGVGDTGDRQRWTDPDGAA